MDSHQKLGVPLLVTLMGCAPDAELEYHENTSPLNQGEAIPGEIQWRLETAHDMSFAVVDRVLEGVENGDFTDYIGDDLPSATPAADREEFFSPDEVLDQWTSFLPSVVESRVFDTNVVLGSCVGLACTPFYEIFQEHDGSSFVNNSQSGTQANELGFDHVGEVVAQIPLTLDTSAYESGYFREASPCNLVEILVHEQAHITGMSHCYEPGGLWYCQDPTTGENLPYSDPVDALTLYTWGLCEDMLSEGTIVWPYDQ